MKNILFGIFLLLAPVTALAQRDADVTPPAQSNPLVRVVKYIGHQVKEVVVEIPKSKEWSAMVAVEYAENLTDSKTTCDGFAHGFRESSMWYGHTQSCAKVTALGIGYTFVRLMFIHTYHDEVIKWAGRDGDPLAPRAGHSMWLIAAPQLIIGARQAECNLRRIDGGCNLRVHPQSMVNRE